MDRVVVEMNQAALAIPWNTQALTGKSKCLIYEGRSEVVVADEPNEALSANDRSDIRSSSAVNSWIDSRVFNIRLSFGHSART
jgi:hypothetical protein